MFPLYIEMIIKFNYSAYRNSKYTFYGTIGTSTINMIQSFVRLTDPYIWKEFKRVLKCKKEKAKYSSAPLSSFLNSAINIEFVYLILNGVNVVMGKIE